MEITNAFHKPIRMLVLDMTLRIGVDSLFNDDTVVVGVGILPADFQSVFVLVGSVPNSQYFPIHLT